MALPLRHQRIVSRGVELSLVIFACLQARARCHSTEIPHILHRVAFANTAERQALLERHQDHSCQELHSDWEHRTWTLRAAEDLLQAHYPWFLPTFIAYPHPISKSEAVADSAMPLAYATCIWLQLLSFGRLVNPVTQAACRRCHSPRAAACLWRAVPRCRCRMLPGCGQQSGWPRHCPAVCRGQRQRRDQRHDGQQATAELLARAHAADGGQSPSCQLTMAQRW